LRRPGVISARERVSPFPGGEPSARAGCFRQGTGGQTVIIDDLARAHPLASNGARWQFVSDQVMGGVSRGTVLPSSEEPVVCFEGTLNDGVTAVFALCSDAAVQGDGECKPSKANCQKIYLKAGESEFLDVAAGTGGLVQYELKVLKVSKTTTTSRSRALRAYARVSKTGRAVMSASSSGRALLRYSAVSGVLFPTAAAKR